LNNNDSKKSKGKPKGKGTTPTLPRIEVPSSLTVKQLADMLEVEPVKIIKQFMRKGFMVNLNQTIDFDAIAAVATDFGYQAQRKTEPKGLAHVSKAKGKKLQTRPPVVTVMGHVDHGKTTLLDVIRKTNVTAHEAGAITQHIGAYQCVVDERKITFLDTPGHEAFTAMRARGAQATDIVVLVVAADDGVMPQTVEAIDHAKAAKVPIIVAINKIDKADANPEKVKQQLADLGLVIEEWGGDVVCVPISARKKEGISDLLENIFLVADILELKANPKSAAEGVVIEARLDRTKGSLATFIVQNGTLEVGDVIVAGNIWGKIKAMFNEQGKQIRKAEPSTPVEVLGLSGVPNSGDIFKVVADEHEAQSVVKGQEATMPQIPLSLTALSRQIDKGQIKELNVVLKTDVYGSIEPVRSSLERLSSENVGVNIIHAGSGSITESDVLLAAASKGIIIGFNSRLSPGAKQLAEAEGVSIRLYDVIYKLIEDVDKALKGMLEPTYVEVLGGRAEVRAVFSGGRKGKVAGVYVREGRIWRDGRAKISRGNKVLCESRISSLKRFKEDVTEVNAGFECGVGMENFNDFSVGDIIELYQKEKVE